MHHRLGPVLPETEKQARELNSRDQNVVAAYVASCHSIHHGSRESTTLVRLCVGCLAEAARRLTSQGSI